MDRVLHAERLVGRTKRRHRLPIDALPDGAVLTLPEEPGEPLRYAAPRLLRWTPSGYGARSLRPAGIEADVLTPPAVLAVLSAGYRPRWHASAGK